MNTSLQHLCALPRVALIALTITLQPLVASMSAAPALAQGLISGDVARAEILPGWLAADGTRMAALRVQMAPGWHTYWRIPGDAGIPPRFDWSRSQNIRSIEPIWPRPQVFVQNGLRSFGFEDELILPLRITPTNPNRPSALMGQLEVGVCLDTCVPMDLQVSAALRGDGGPDARISAALAERAEAADRFGLTRTTCSVQPTERGADLTLRATVPQTGRDELIVMELPGSGYWISNSRTWREGADLVAQARIRDPQRGPVGVNRSALAFTILSNDRMVNAQGCVGG